MEVEFDRAEGNKNREAVTSSVKYSGYAWVNDVSVNAPNRQNASYSIQLAGDGPLTKGGIVSQSDI